MKWLRHILAILFVVVLPYLALSQSGPFGIGNATGADGQPKLLLWLDGSTVTSSLNNNVISWPDKSGNGNDFTALAATSPILRSGGPEGENFLDFSRPENRMTLSNLTFENQGVSIFYVFRTNDADYGMFSFAESDANSRQILVQQSAGVNALTVSGNQENTSHGDLSTGQWRYAGFVWDGISDPTYWHRSNGTSTVELTQNDVLGGESSPATGTAVIGHIQNLLDGGYVTDESFQGDLAEVIVFDGKLNKAMLRLMNSYFRAKYQLGHSGGFDKLKAPAPYREGVIGVGREVGSPSTEHRHSSRDGLVLKANPGALVGNYDYLSAGHNVGANAIVSNNTVGAVEARWSRDWYIRKSPNCSGISQFLIAFDLGDGINGAFPNFASNYRLLYRSGTSGNYVPASVEEEYILDDQIVFRVKASEINETGYYSLGTTDNLISSLEGQITRTWHAYQSGDWSNPTTWTLDGSAAPFYINPGNETPGTGDAIVIGSGRTVLMDVDNRQHQSLDLKGNLDIASTSGHNFGSIKGDGLIRCAGSAGVGNFPLGNTTDFADPITGGVVEFYGAGFTQNVDLEINRFILNLNALNSEVVLAANLVHNGRFDLTKGTLRINNTANVSRIIASNNDVVVGANGRIIPSVSSGNRKHVWTFEGDLINNGGDIRFTNRTSPAYTTNESQHWVEARFVSAVKNQSLVADGTTYLSRVVINKGSDMSYTLSLSSDDANNFKLLGFCNDPMSQTPIENEIQNKNSCALINGTLEVQENIFIPLHAGVQNYNINASAMLWVNGGHVAKGAPLVGTSNKEAIVVYGHIKVSAGVLDALCKSGITTRDNGVIQIDGGVINANQIRTSVLGNDNIGGIIINGGLVNVDGTMEEGANSNYYTFSLTYAGNLFRMTGGILKVAGPTTLGLIFINSDPEQTSVTGGTIIAEVKNTSTTHKISTKAPLWNLEIQRTNASGTNRPVIISGGNSNGEILANQPLVIKNNLTIGGTNATLRAYPSVATASLDVHIQGGLTIEDGGVYNHGENTTFFDGIANSLLALPTASTQTFYNLKIAKATESRFAKIQSGNIARAIEVQGDFDLLSGSFDNSIFNVGLEGDAILNRTFGLPTSTGTAFFEGSAAQTLSVSNGVFHNLTLDNSSGLSLINGTLISRGELTLETGNFILGSQKLRLEGDEAVLYVTSPSATKCFVTDGSASAGGLELNFNATNQSYWFPLGVDDGGVIKYTPAYTGINSGFSDDGYIRMVPVNEYLPTVDITGGNDYLDFYWRVNHSEFDNIPKVSHQFEYDNSHVVNNESAFGSGRVLNENTFLRELDSLNISTDHVNTGTNSIYFNGESDAGNTVSGTGRILTNADYSAGNKERFEGKPQVFYSRSTTYKANWNNAANWNELAMFAPADGPYQHHSNLVANTNTDYPQEGDIAFVGFNPANGKPHVYAAPAGGIDATKVSFTPLQDGLGNLRARYEGLSATDITILRPTLSFSNTSEIAGIQQISGEGALLVDAVVDMEATDIGDFLSQDSSIVIIETGVAIMNFTSFPAVVPNLFITSGSNGSADRGVRISQNFLVRGDLEIAGNANYLLPTGLVGDVIIQGDLKLGQYQASTSGAELKFGNSGTPRSVEVLGNISITGANGIIAIENPNVANVFHELTAWGSIYQNAPGFNTGLKLFTNGATDEVILNLRGAGNHVYINDGGGVPSLGHLIMDKGTSIASSFSFNSDVEIDASESLTGSAVDLHNGLLKFDHSSIDITLSSGGGGFYLPSTAGLELGDGILRLKGQDTGLILDGLLRVISGNFYLGDAANQNNYLEYSSGGTAKIELSGGNIFVGGQVRRGLTNTSGVLKYYQSGGVMTVGVYDAPDANRGVFEILNTGSHFVFTGGEIVFVRGINSSNAPSLLLEPTTSNISGTGIIKVGNPNSPPGGQIENFGIKSAISIPSLLIGNGSFNNPKVHIFATPLSISNLLDIDNGATFDCKYLDLTVSGDISNDGLLTSTSGKLIINHETAGSISGSGIYTLIDLSKTGLGNTSVSTDLLVQNIFRLEDGQMDFGTKMLNVKGDVTVDGNLFFDLGSQGLLMDGNGSQELSRTSTGVSQIDILTTDNPSGIEMEVGASYTFKIEKELRMKRGVFDLKGNLLRIGSAGEILPINAFGQNNMISTGGAFTNYGVEKTIPANTTNDVFIPLGMNHFMPVRLILSDIGYTSGDAESTYIFSLNIPVHTVVTNVANAPDPEWDETQNVLQMYHSLKASGVGAGLLMDIEFSYDDFYVATTAPNTEAEYIAARIVDNTPNPDVYKFSGAVDAGINVINLSFNNVTSAGITGDYFAGIESAIPENVPVYTTTTSGDVIDELYDIPVPGGGAPSGAVVVIESDDTLSLNIDGVNLYKTIINANSVLNIDGTAFHRLGIVEGTGTIRLNDTGSLPAGIYNDFFSCFGGKIEYAGSTDYEVLANLPIVREVKFTGTGKRDISNNDIQICENFIVDGPQIRNVIASNLIVNGDVDLTSGAIENMQGNITIDGDLNIAGGSFSATSAGVKLIFGDVVLSAGSMALGSGGSWILLGDLVKTGGAFNGGSSSALLSFKGTTRQHIDGDFMSVSSIANLEIDNAFGLQPYHNVEVDLKLKLTNGNIYTGVDSLIQLASNATSVEPLGGSPSSFVDGPMNWNLTTSNNRVFPVGKADRYRPFTLANRSASRLWTVAYFDTLALVEPAVLSMLPANPSIVETVSIQEYWKVNSNTGSNTSAKVGLSWGENSAVAPDPNDYQALVALTYNEVNDNWDSKGAEQSTFSYDSGTDIGFFLSGSPASFTERIFTLGSSQAINALPVTWLGFEGHIVGNANVLTWSTASEIDNEKFELERSLDAEHWTALGTIPGAGFSISELHYSFTDRTAPHGLVYYRLKQIDFDGKVDFAPEIVVLERSLNFDFEDASLLVYPNPSRTGSARMMVSQIKDAQVNLRITEIDGRLVQDELLYIDGQGRSDEFDCTFTPGIYVIQIYTSDNWWSTKLVVSP